MSHPFLKSTKTNDYVSPLSAFMGAAIHNKLFDDVVTNGPPKKITLRAQYLPEDHYVVETPKGPVSIQSIEFTGEIFRKETRVPLLRAEQYCRADTQTQISQVAVFDAMGEGDSKLVAEFHHLVDEQRTHLVVRKP